MGPVIITGGTSGIGLGVAHRIIETGGRVLVLGRDRARGRQALEQLGQLSDARGRTAFVAGDTCDDDALATAVHACMDRWGPPTGLVTAAGRLARGAVNEVDADALRAALETNVVGTWLAIQAVLPTMVEHLHGRIVTIGSVLGTVGAADRAAYASTKGAVAALSRSIAIEVASSGVTVNCVAPGPTRTPMNADKHPGRSDSAAEEAFTRQVPVGRWGTPADVARAVVPLLQQDSGWTTGATIHVDGGYTAH